MGSALRGLAATTVVTLLAGCFSTGQSGTSQNSGSQTSASGTSSSAFPADANSSSTGYPGDNTTPPPNDSSSPPPGGDAANISKVSFSDGELVVDGTYTNNFQSDDATCATLNFVLVGNGEESMSSTGDPCDESDIPSGSSTTFHIAFDNVAAGTYDLKVARSSSDWEHHQITVTP